MLQILWCFRSDIIRLTLFGTVTYTPKSQFENFHGWNFQTFDVFQVLSSELPEEWALDNPPPAEEISEETPAEPEDTKPDDTMPAKVSPFYRQAELTELSLV